MSQERMKPEAPTTYDAFRQAGWTDEQLVAHGYMTPETSVDALVTDERLRLLIERVERLEEEKKGIADDIRDVWAEAKAVGYDTKIGREIVKLRRMKPDDRAEREALLETYKIALGLG